MTQPDYKTLDDHAGCSAGSRKTAFPFAWFCKILKIDDIAPYELYRDTT